MWSGLNSVGVGAPHLGAVVQRLREHGDRGALGHRVPAADHGVRVGRAGEARRGRPQAQGLVEDLPDVAEAVHLLERRRGRAAEHLVDLGAGPGHDVRVLHQVVDRERQQARRRLVARDEERDALGPDVLVRQVLAVLVDAVEHAAQQVRGVARGALGAAFGDDPVDEVVHERRVLFELPLRAHPQPGLDRQLPRAGLGLGEHPDHRVDERVRGLAVERVEPVAEAAQRDRVEREPGHVRGDVDLLAGVEPRPLVHQLVGDVEHLGHVVAHRLQAERGHEHVVRAHPQRVVGLGGEEARPGRAALQHGQPAADLLVEPRVVADLVDEVRPGHEQPHPARHADLEDRPVLLGHAHEAAERVGAVDVEDVAQHGNAARAGDGLHAASMLRRRARANDRTFQPICQLTDQAVSREASSRREETPSFA